MELFVTSLVAVKIPTFCPVNSYTVSYGELYIRFLEVRHFFSEFTICDMAPESAITVFLS